MAQVYKWMFNFKTLFGNKVHMEKRIWHNEEKDKVHVKKPRDPGSNLGRNNFFSEHFFQGISTIKEKRLGAAAY